jgi:hypothetical protein
VADPPRIYGQALDPAAAAAAERKPPGVWRRTKMEAELGIAELVESNQALLERLIALEAHHNRLAHLLAVERRRVLWSGTALIGANGVWSINVRQDSQAIFVINYNGNANVTVSAAAAQGAAPGPGAGTHNCPAGVAATFLGKTTDWTLYGTPGNAVDVQILSVAAHPFAAGAI